MSYTPTEWSTGDTITAALLNKMENGIAAGGGGGGYDAVIRLVHGASSGADSGSSLAPYIVEGTFAGLVDKLEDDIAPVILIEYHNEYLHISWSMVGAIVTYYAPAYTVPFVMFTPCGYFNVNGTTAIQMLPSSLVWNANDEIGWD